MSQLAGRNDEAGLVMAAAAAAAAAATLLRPAYTSITTQQQRQRLGLCNVHFLTACLGVSDGGFALTWQTGC